MTVVVLTAVPSGLRGHLTRWLLEISPGVFVGHASRRVRDEMWHRIIEYLADGRALMVHSSNNEQGLEFTVHGHDWTPVDHDGIALIRRPTTPTYIPSPHAPMTQPHSRTPEGNPAPRSRDQSDDTVWKRRQARRKFKRK